jgi:hypothetical protein
VARHASWNTDAREKELMSHRSVEIVLGRLMTDEAFRRQFQRAPREALAELPQMGLDLSAVEMEAIAALDAESLIHFVGTLDPRLKKAALPAD